MRLIYADYNPYTNSIDVNTFENYILRIAAFCGLSFLLAIKITSKVILSYISLEVYTNFGMLPQVFAVYTSDSRVESSLIRYLLALSFGFYFHR